MAVYFDPEVVYKTAFYFSQRDVLTQREIAKFTSLLRQEITKNPNYPLVCFCDFEESDLDYFFGHVYFGRMNVIDKKIILSQKITDKEIEFVNSGYDEYIVDCLQKVGKNFLLN